MDWRHTELVFDPTRIQSIGEVIYGVIYKMVEDICGKDGVKYFPYIFSIFLFILAANLLGLIPYSFTTTSHIAVTALLAFVIFIVITTSCAPSATPFVWQAT